MADDKRKHTKDENTQPSKAGKTPRSAADLRQRDLSSDIQGRNKLQGNDQESVRNQRREQPKVGGATGRPAGKSKD